MPNALAYIGRRVPLRPRDDPPAVPRALAHIGRRAPAVGVLIVGCTLAGSWLLSGVTASEAARYVAFEGLYVLLPGCLLYVLLSPSPGGWLPVIAIGWPVGYALEVGAFALTADLGARGVFTFLPLIAAVAIGPLVYARRRASLRDLRQRLAFARPGTEPRYRLDVLVVSGAIAIGLTLLALRAFAFFPLPRDAQSVYYSGDNLYHISIAAEARHHWPVTAPYTAGTSLRYYIGAFLHFAAVNQAVGVSLATIVLRLFPSTMIVVIALQLWLLGAMVGGKAARNRRWIGPLTVILFLVVEDLNLDPTRATGFGVDFFNSIPGSPTAALGVVFFLGLVALVHAPIAGGLRRSAAPSPGLLARALPSDVAKWLVLLAILALGAGAAKIFAAVDFLGGLGLYWMWRAGTAKVDRWLWYSIAVATACYFIIDYLLLSGNELSPTLTIRPFAFVESTSLWPLVAGHSAIKPVILVAAGIAICVCAFAPLLGSVWLLFKPNVTSSFAVFLIVQFVFSFVAYASLIFINESLIYLLWYGYLAMLPVAALGLAHLWATLPAEHRARMIRACATALIVGIALAGSTRVLAAAGVLSGARRTSWYVWYGVAYGGVGALILLFALRLERSFQSALSSRASRVIVCCIPLLVTLGLVKPVALGAPRLAETLLHERIPVPDSPEHPGLTAALYKGLTWVRDHTTPCDVLAVNTHMRGRVEDDHYPYYSALTERRVFLEAWNTTVPGTRGEQAFPARFALNSQATQDGDPRALRELARIGVSYVLIDRTHGGGAPEPASVSRLVFDNGALAVYRLLEPPGENTGSRCAMISWHEPPVS